ncbi:HelD family protein [Tessaracoccus lapidicaptus]|uniref:HelD family protein n=1 Tax=Tessaracoccus lapidicaptus TaxID=1427523 RepID=UPI00334245DA
MSAPTLDKHREDQAHFDRAWEAREARRQKYEHIGEAAAGPKAGAALIKHEGKRMASRLGEPDEAVAVGRIDTADEVRYIGRHVILDSESDPLVISWASPEAQPFYAATIDDAMGLIRKRSFDTKKNRIVSVQDIVFKDVADRVKGLQDRDKPQMTDALLQDLERDRSSEMQDIVQTIHHSQYHVIERPLDELLIVQGGPGTGKTAVALHRVAWLLYNFSDILRADGVLVVSPNSAFTQYIRKVLPSLGEASVDHIDLTRLSPVSSSSRAEPFETTRLKGERRMADLLSRALWSRVRPPQGARISVETSTGVANVSADEVRGRIERWRSAPGPYADRRAELRRVLGDLVLGQPGRRPADVSTLDRETERIWPALTPARFVQELLGSRQRLSEAAGDDFTARDVERLYRQSAGSLSAEEWSDADVALLDEADWLINGRSAGYSHIVIDEAQDLSAMQLRSIARRSATGSYTLVGDLAQSTGPWARESWEDVFVTLRSRGTEQRLETLRYGYRVPRQVFEFARPLLAFAAPEVEAPIVIRDAPRDPVIVSADPDDVVGLAVMEAQEHASKGLLVGVIAPEALWPELEAAMDAAEISHKSPANGGLGTSINLMTAAQSKGLEFDATVVVEPAGIVHESEHGLRRLYIALTRTTRFMSVIYSQAVPEIGLRGDEDEERMTSEGPEPEFDLEEQLAPEPMIPSAAQLKPRSYEKSTTSQRADAPRSTPNRRLERLVSEAADELAEEITAVLAQPAYGLLLEALADRLGVQISVTEVPTNSPPPHAAESRTD